MKVVHITLSRFGGAGAAALRSVKALRQAGCDAQLCSIEGTSEGEQLRHARCAGWRARLSSAPELAYPKRRYFSSWSNDWVPSRLAGTILKRQPDIVHLHWVAGGFMHLEEIRRFRCPVVWTLHDAWPFTGGCHYPGTCDEFKRSCGRCPQLGSSHRRDLSFWNLRAKRDRTGLVDHWISPSQWLGTMAISGGLCAPALMSIVPNAVDGAVFRPSSESGFRERLRLKPDAIVLVAGAADLSDRRKGAWLLPEALSLIQQRLARPCVLLVFGGQGAALAAGGAVDIRSLGHLAAENEIASVLASADVLLLPSLQDNLPNIAVEAQACGCPIVGFDSGGLLEIIEPGRTGLVTSSLSAAGLAEAAVSWLTAVRNRDSVTQRCRQRYESCHSLPSHAARLSRIYSELLAKRP